MFFCENKSIIVLFHGLKNMATQVFTNGMFKTTISGNEILIEATLGSTIQGTNTNRLGYTTTYGSTARWQNPIWFRFYKPNAEYLTLGTLRTFVVRDISSPTYTASMIGNMLALLFPNYYDTIESTQMEIDVPQIIPLFERLNNTIPTTNWSTSTSLGTTPGSDVVFNDYGVGYTGMRPIINSLTYSLGRFCYEAHITNIDPLANATIYPAKYRYLMKALRLSDVNNDNSGILIYTNLFDDAFNPNGMLHYLQFLALWPVLSFYLLTNVNNASFTQRRPLAIVGSSLDSNFLQKGQGYFDRASRRNTTNGWWGNTLMSYPNQFTITREGSNYTTPIIPILAGYNEYLLMRNMQSIYNVTTLPFSNDIPCIWTGNEPNDNMELNNAKSFVRIIMFYTSLVERYGFATASGYIATIEANIVALHGLSNISEYYQGCVNAFPSQSYYGYFFRYAKSIAYSTSTMFDSFVAPYMDATWVSTINNLVLLGLSNYSNTIRLFIGPTGNTSTYYSSDTYFPYSTAMSVSQETALTTYTYP